MDEHTQAQTPRRWWPWVAGGALVVALGVGAAIVVPPLLAPGPSDLAADAADTGDDDDVSTDPLALAGTPTAGPLSDDEQAEIARATAAADAVVAVSDEIGQRGDGSDVGLDALATGWALGELQSKAREQYDLGYRQTGEAIVTGVTPTAVDLTAEPATITLKVCVDVSGIDVLDAAGNSLKASLYDPGHPVAHLYGAVFEGDTWKIATHDIPDVQDCPAA